MTKAIPQQIKAVIFDWAGTMIDFGSLAPAVVFTDLFNRHGITVTPDEAREPMGLPKREHIKAMLAMPRIAKAFAARYGAPPDDKDIDRLYAEFLPLNENVAAEYAKMIPGAVEAIEVMRGRGAKIGSTTGYSRSVMDKILPIAAKAGYTPDNLVCGDDLAAGRPSPVMMYRCFADLAVYPPGAVVKVDDTTPGIAEGLAAGCITVGVVASSNYVGLSEAGFSALPGEKQQEMKRSAADKLLAAGADYIIDTVADLPGLLQRGA